MEKHWRINEAAELLGVSVDTLRYWERQGKLSSERTDGGHRRYSATNLAPHIAARRGISEAAALAELKGERLSDAELAAGALPTYNPEEARRAYEEWLKTHPAFPLGLGDLDHALPHKGVHAGWLALFQGKAASGKTSVLSQIALNLTHQYRKNVLLVTLEERQDTLLRRLGAQRTGASPSEISVEQALAALPSSLAVVSHLPSSDGYEPLTPARLEAVIIEHNQNLSDNAQLDVVIVDQLGFMRPNRQRRNLSLEHEYGEIADELFQAAKSLDVFFLTAAQMPKGVQQGQPFGMQEGYSYGVLDYFDLVYHLWRPAYDVQLSMRQRKKLQSQLEMALVKNRFGPAAEQTFTFDQTSLRVRPEIERPH